MVISLFCMVELDTILHPGTSACLHKNAESFVTVLRVFRNQGMQVSKGRICNSDHSLDQLIKRHLERKSTAGNAGVTGVQEYRSTGVQEFRSSGVTGVPGVPGVQEYRSSVVSSG